MNPPLGLRMLNDKKRRYIGQKDTRPLEGLVGSMNVLSDYYIRTLCACSLCPARLLDVIGFLESADTRAKSGMLDRAGARVRWRSAGGRC